MINVFFAINNSFLIRSVNISVRVYMIRKYAATRVSLNKKQKVPSLIHKNDIGESISFDKKDTYAR